jgi:hypothetical protein
LAQAAWLTIEDYPSRPTPTDLLSFFGIPPDPESKLDDNINRKRRHWHRLAQTAPPEGRRLAEAVKSAIAEAANALKRGAAAAGGGPAASQSPVDASAFHDPKTVDELWRVIQRLLFRQRYADAIECARVAARKWPNSTEPFVAYAWVVNTALAQGDHGLPTNSVDQAIRVMERVMQVSAGGREYRIIIGLLQTAGRIDEALERSYQAEDALQPFPADMLGLRVGLQARAGDIDAAMVTAVVAVHGHPSDDGIRGECVDALLGFALQRLLPVSSPESALAYGRLVRVAAWCADGVPDLEDRVRMHRLWAANCAQKVFAGNVALRSFVAIISGFLLLPVYNSASSRPSWQVLQDGPVTIGRAKTRRMKNFAFYQVASSPYVKAVHEDAAGKFSWVHESGRWPDLEALVNA